MNCASSAVLSDSSPLAFASFPVTTSNCSSFPEARARTFSFVAMEPGRMVAARGRAGKRRGYWGTGFPPRFLGR